MARRKAKAVNNRKAASRLPGIAPEPARAMLNPGDLDQFRLRRANYEMAANHLEMVEESYKAFVNTLRERYDIVAERFDVDLRTGTIIPREEENVG